MTLQYRASLDGIAGLEERCQKISDVLTALAGSGFSRPVAYGKGLSQFLNGMDKTKTDIQITCDYPKDLKPGKLKRVFFDTATVKKDMFYDAYKRIMSVPDRPYALNGTTYNSNHLDRYGDGNTIALSARGFSGQRLDITAHTQDMSARTADTNNLLDKELAPIHKVAMHYDETIGGVITTHHPQFQADSARNFYRITEDLSLDEAQRSLAHYFHERARGVPLALMIDDTSLQKGDVPLQARARHLHGLHRTALKVHTANMVGCGDPDPEVSDYNTYHDAALFMDRLIG